ncbi:hypothetical protein SASPL_144622 [Salvia splendens]|uniref:Uncharacterized protein n=1 Tax=Salvia splendens TaxID=180675 RepID=A0A8X8WG19_SALSN|nr:hypothetical protein SASPL_144622 [Salvia splendens]
MNIPPQSQYLYAGKWTPESDAILCDSLIDEFEVVDRVDSLHTRYLTLKELCKQKGVQWLPETRSVIAPDCLWEKICKSNLVATRESTTEPGIYFIDIGPDGKLRTRVEKGQVLPKDHPMKESNVKKFDRASNASSNGSNSPLGRWPHLHK